MFQLFKSLRDHVAQYPFLLSMRHVAYGWGVSHMNAACRIWMRRVAYEVLHVKTLPRLPPGLARGCIGSVSCFVWQHICLQVWTSSFLPMVLYLGLSVFGHFLCLLHEGEHIHIHIYIYRNHTRKNTRTHLYTFLHSYFVGGEQETLTHICIYIHTYIYVCIYMCVYTYMYIYICIYAYIYIHIYIYIDPGKNSKESTWSWATQTAGVLNYYLK